MSTNTPPPTPESILHHAQRMQTLTHSYARFAHSAGGLAAVLGGVLCVASYLAGGVLPPSPGLHWALMAMPIAWLITKQRMTRHYYQRHGRVTQTSSAAEQRQRVLFTGFSGLVSVVVAAGMLTERAFGLNEWDAPWVGYLLAVAALPLITWRWLRTPLDYVVGSFLVCQAALATTGQAYSLWGSSLVFPLAALMLILTGLRDHRRFLAIDAEIRQLLQSRKADA